MDTLLLYFALPIAIIILSIVLQKILRCPILVGATFFAILLIVAFTAFDSSFLIFVIIYPLGSDFLWVKQEVNFEKKLWLFCIK